MKEKKVGVWLIGALGSVSSAVILGALALRHGLTDSTGMITVTEPFERLRLVPVEALEFGGCDIRRGSLREAARELAKEIGGNWPSLLIDLEDHLVEIEEHVTPGSGRNCGDAVQQLMAYPLRGDKSIREEIAEVMSQLDHFKGFLDAKMSLQFVWHGHDSLLAAPLVLDLIRLAEFAKRRGEGGLMPHLACYFKSPLRVDEHRLREQFQMLVDYVIRAEATP
jgi:hypothetical protein